MNLHSAFGGHSLNIVQHFWDVMGKGVSDSQRTWHRNSVRNSLWPILSGDFWLRISHIANADTGIKTENKRWFPL